MNKTLVYFLVLAITAVSFAGCLESDEDAFNSKFEILLYIQNHGAEYQGPCNITVNVNGDTLIEKTTLDYDNENEEYLRIPMPKGEKEFKFIELDTNTVLTIKINLDGDLSILANYQNSSWLEKPIWMVETINGIVELQ